MLTQENCFCFHDMNPMTKTLSITIMTIVKNDGIEIARSADTRAFAPGQADDVKKYINCEKCPETDYIEAVWTEKVIQDYKDLMERNSKLHSQ